MTVAVTDSNQTGRCNIKVINHGTVVQFIPCTEGELRLMREVIDHKPWQWLGRSLVLDPKAAANVLALIDVQAAADAGGRNESEVS